MTGLAQKGGAVMSHVRLADNAEQLHSTRVGTGMADLVIGCDLIVTAGKDAYPVWVKAVPCCDQCQWFADLHLYPQSGLAIPRRFCTSGYSACLR
jgi:hypothetical protein